MKTQNSERLSQARNLYFNTTLSQAQIAELIGVSQKTVSLYISQNNWKLLKKRSTQLPSVFIEQMNTELLQMNKHIAARPEGQQFPTSQEAEVRRKILYSLSAIKDRQSAGTHMETFMNLLTFISRESNADALTVSNYIQDFLKVEYNVPHRPPHKHYDLAGNPLPNPLFPTNQDEVEEEEEEEEYNNYNTEEQNKAPQNNNRNNTSSSTDDETQGLTFSYRSPICLF